MRKPEFFLWVLLVVTVTAATTSIFHATRGQSAIAGGNAEIYRQLDLFADVLERVRSDYVERPDDTKLIDNAINGMLNGLDPHSSFMNAKNFDDMQVQTKGEFGGLGIEVTMEDGFVKVVSPIENTPAEKAGILPNDYITHLDNESIQGITLEEAVEKMRGPVNAPIVLTVMRKGVADPFDVKIVRDVVRINPVRFNAEDDVAYIRIKQFSEQTTEELKRAIEEMKKTIGPKLKGYVIDLRNNPGGLLDQAVGVSDAFLDQGAIVLTRGRNLSETQRQNAKLGDLTDGKEVVVLINGGSASASEIVAGAIQDQKRGVVVGTRSFGKGSVQTIIPLGSKNGAIRLTTARYYTPSGRSIQAKGIEPTHVVEQDLPEDGSVKPVTSRGEASLRGHLKNEGEGKENSGSSAYVPKDKEKDKQLKFALDYIRGFKEELKKADILARKNVSAN
ncbi:MAG: S41 family peptidase [Hyphomicrobiales bacterium]|nr:S41 family peptidase [Hyphomicrobiales bacterium]